MAANPCPCGYAYGNGERCTCREKDRIKYFSRLSGPILARIDIQIEVPPVERINPGTVPSGESSHAIRAAIDEAVKCRETGEEKTIVFGLTGTGYFDMVAYNKFNDGEMGDYIPTDEDLAKGFATIPSFPGNE